MRKAAPLLAVAVLVLLMQSLGGLLTACHAEDGPVRLELVHGDCCEGPIVESSAGCCGPAASPCGESPEAEAEAACARGPEVGLADCCQSVELLFRFVSERPVEGADGSHLATAALPPAAVDGSDRLPAGGPEGSRATGPVPRPPPALRSLRTVVFLC